MPSSVVIIKPPGSLPGIKSFATTPTMNPIMIVHMILMQQHKRLSIPTLWGVSPVSWQVIFLSRKSVDFATRSLHGLCTKSRMSLPCPIMNLRVRKYLWKGVVMHRLASATGQQEEES